MAEYIVKNLNKSLGQEVRIYRVDKTSTLAPVENFHILNDLSGSVSVRLKPNYTIDCTGAINTVGILQSTITAGTLVVTNEGDPTTVNNASEMTEVLKTNFGLDAIVLDEYVPPVIDIPNTNEMYFTTIAGTINYSGQAGDIFTLSDGSIINLEGDLAENIVVPAGKHKITLIEPRNGNIGLGGEALIELHNFPTLASVTSFDFFGSDSVISNLTTVPTTLPSNITSLAYMFGFITNFNQDISTWDVSHVTNMESMFYGATAFNQPIGNWNVSNVTNMFQMFFNAAAFNQPLNNWNTVNITNMAGMFSGATLFNQPLNSWNTSNVTDMSYMFGNAFEFNQDISLWNTSKVTNMQGMFSKASALNLTLNFNQDLSQWCVGLITEEPTDFNIDGILQPNYYPVWGTCPRGESGPVPAINEMYFTTLAGTIDYSGEIGDVINFSDGSVFNLESNLAENITLPAGTHKVIFNEVRESNYVGLGGVALVELYNFPALGTITNFDFCPGNNSLNLTKVPATLPSNITNTSYMFKGAELFNQNISSWNTSNVTDMSYMFSGATLFDQPLDTWNTANVTNMSNMFIYSTNFNQLISSWNVSQVTDMSGMFSNTNTFNKPLDTWDVNHVTDMSGMFSGATLFNQPLGGWNTINVVNMSSMFGSAINFNQNISGWNTSSVTDMSSMFFGTNGFNQDISNWNTKSVSNMNYMFELASAFNQNLSQWCVGLIPSLPDSFATGSALIAGNLPIWGTCPRGENLV